MFRIREVDADENDIAETIKELHTATFATTPAPPPEFDADCFWWLAYDSDVPIAFAGLRKSMQRRSAGYLYRAGVLPSHRGNGLQRRLIKVRESKAKKLGWSVTVTDTTLDNVASSNNLIASGYRMFKPGWAWSFVNAIYWIKDLAA